MAWKYLLSPTFQVVNTAGKPATGGYIEVYVHGTRDRYYCASDFDGTLHPFKIPLDSLGANIVLADDSQTYDVYVYNRYGSLIMSRYDVPTVRGKDSAYSGDVSDATATFTKDVGDLSEISSGSTLKVLFTKISKFFAGLKRVAFTGSYNDLSNKPDVKKGKLHRIGVRLVQESDPSPKPMTDWVIDLESPNANEPDGYDRLTVSKAIEIHDAGEVFAFTSGGLDIYYESLFTSSGSYVHMTLVRCGFHQRPNEISLATVDNFGDYLGVSDALQDSEYWNVELVREGSDELRQNKIHRYSFGDGVVDGETPVYGSWLIDLDKPDPNGPEGYARVTPSEFWKAVATNNEVPVYLQDKNSDNSLTYAYLSRADVTKSGSTVTNVFMFFVRSGYGNNLDQSYGFKFTKLDGSDYIQKAAYDSLFTALSGNTKYAASIDLSVNPTTFVCTVQLKDQDGHNIGNPSDIDLPLESVVVSGSYDDTTKKIVLTLQNGSTVEFSVADLVSGLLADNGDGKNVTVTFSQASSRTNISTGEKLSTLFGKIKKWFADLASVAFSGDYGDLINKPNLATVATSGSYADLSNKPSIPAAQVQSDWSQSDNTKVDFVKNKPNLAAVATSGNYNDLSNRPSIPAAQVQSDWNESNNASLAFIKNKPSIVNTNYCTVMTTNGTRYITQQEVNNKYADVTTTLSIKFWADFAMLHMSLRGITMSNGQYMQQETDVKYSVYVGNASNPTAVLIREIPLLGSSDRDDMGRLIGDIGQNETAYFLCTMLGQGFHLVCDRVTIRIDWSDNRTTFGQDTSSWFQMDGNRIFLTMPDDTSLWPSS